MSLKHVNQYFLEVEYQYFEMLDDLKELEQLLQENKIDEESYLSVKREVEIMKQNYERIAYIIFLLKKPNKKGKRITEKDKSWYNALNFASKEVILNENNDVLKHIKKLITEGKIKNG